MVRGMDQAQGSIRRKKQPTVTPERILAIALIIDFLERERFVVSDSSRSFPAFRSRGLRGISFSSRLSPPWEPVVTLPKWRGRVVIRVSRSWRRYAHEDRSSLINRVR